VTTTKLILHMLLVLAPTLSYAVTPEQHKTFEKCYKTIVPSYLRDSLSAPATVRLENNAIGNATGTTNTNNTERRCHENL
jgi:hypothetical protein